MEEESTGGEPTAAASQIDAEESKAPHPLAAALDGFTERIDTLIDTLQMSLAMLHVVDKNAHQRFKTFLETNCNKVEGSADEYRIPPEHFVEFQRHHKREKRRVIARTSIPRSHIVALVSEFDAFVGSLLKILFSLKPDALTSSQKPFTFAELTEIGSIEEAREYLIEREVEALLRNSHADQFEQLGTRFGLPLTKDLDVWPSFIELTERRNLFVHNSGIVTRNYLEKCRQHGYDCSSSARGAVLEAPPEYFRSAYNILYELGVKLTHVFWRKVDKQTVQQADSHFSDVIYELVRSGNYSVAQVLADFGVNTLRRGCRLTTHGGH